MYKASRYEVSPDLKHVLLAYNVAAVSFSFVFLFVFSELANWQPNISDASGERSGVGSNHGELWKLAAHRQGGGGRACVRFLGEWGAQLSGTVAKVAETHTTPSAPHGAGREADEIDGKSRKQWLGIHHFSTLFESSNPRLHLACQRRDMDQSLSPPNIAASDILNHSPAYLLFACPPSILLQPAYLFLLLWKMPTDI